MLFLFNIIDLFLNHRIPIQNTGLWSQFTISIISPSRLCVCLKVEFFYSTRHTWAATRRFFTRALELTPPYCPVPSPPGQHPPHLYRLQQDGGGLYTASRLLGGPVSDSDLLFLKIPISAPEIHLIFTVLIFTDLVWSTISNEAAISPLSVKAALSRAPHPLQTNL